MEHGAEINVPRNIDRITPLFKAALSGHKLVVEYLLEKGADTSCRWDNCSPSQIAKKYGHQEVAEIIQKHDKKHGKNNGMLWPYDIVLIVCGRLFCENV